MKKLRTATKKLVLNKDRLAKLGEVQLGGVAGGNNYSLLSLCSCYPVNLCRTQ